MTQEQLQDFFERKEFSVHLFDEEDNGVICAEIEKWTNGGVDMIIVLRPFTAEAFEEYVKDFDVDDEIDGQRLDPKYKEAFRISESFTDFTEFKEHLEEILTELKNQE